MIGGRILRTSRYTLYSIASQPWWSTLTETSWVLRSSSIGEIASLQTLARGASNPAPFFPSLQNFHSAPFLSATLQVQVPPLGESITDGAIAQILKQPGDSVEEDEPIIQIETDKVTIDVRSPTSGIIEAILVKVDENVNVGHVVASILAGEAPGKVEGKAPPQPTTLSSTTQPASNDSASSSSSSSSSSAAAAAHISPSHSPTSTTTFDAQHTATAAHRHSSISFPPRRTVTGDIISMMPVEQAKAVVQSLLSPSTSSILTTPQVTPSTPFFRPRPPRMGPPPKPRQELTEKEMDIVMLGGADGW